MYIRPCLVCGKLMEGEYDKRVKYHSECIPICKMEGCGKGVFNVGLGLCQKHYMRWWHGQPETNPCKGCGTMIDSRYKWCANCKALHKDINGRSGNPERNYCPQIGDNIDCPRRVRCRKKGCVSPEGLENNKKELLGGLMAKNHGIKSSIEYEPRIYRIGIGSILRGI